MLFFFIEVSLTQFIYLGSIVYIKMSGRQKQVQDGESKNFTAFSMVLQTSLSRQFWIFRTFWHNAWHLWVYIYILLIIRIARFSLDYHGSCHKFYEFLYASASILHCYIVLEVNHIVLTLKWCQKTEFCRSTWSVWNSFWSNKNDHCWSLWPRP